MGGGRPLLLCLYLALFCSMAAAFRIISSNAPLVPAGSTYASPSFRGPQFRYPFEPIVGQLVVVAEDVHACEFGSPVTGGSHVMDVSGKVVLMVEGGACSTEVKLPRLEALGALAALRIVNEGTPAYLDTLWSRAMPPVSMPVVAVREQDSRHLLAALLQQNRTATGNYTVIIVANVTALEENPMVALAGSWYIAFSVEMTLVNVALLALNVQRMYAFFRYGCAFGIGHLSISLDLIGNVFRFCWCLFPWVPWGFGHYPSAIFFSTFGLFIHFTLTLVLAFFWMEIATNIRSNSMGKLVHYKWFFLVVCFVMFSAEMATGALRVLPLAGSDIMILATSALYMIVDVATGIFFIVTSYRLIQMMQRGARWKSSHRIRSMAVFVLLHSLAGVFILVVGLLLGLTELPGDDAWWMALWWAMMNALAMGSLVRMMTFKGLNESDAAKLVVGSGSTKNTSSKNSNSKNKLSTSGGNSGTEIQDGEELL